MLVKDCLDIRHWRGYDASSKEDRRTYYTEWYPRFVVDSVNGNALKDNSLNRYQVNVFLGSDTSPLWCMLAHYLYACAELVLDSLC